MSRTKMQPVQIGEKLGRLTVIADAGRTEQQTKLFLCKCDCGKEKIVAGVRLRSGNVRSCGCLRSEVAAVKAKTHGESKTRLYHIWQGIKKRCENPKSTGYQNYGGRGIVVCDEWQDFNNFYSWAMANGYSDDLSIDRIDLDGNYEPSNCRWADKNIQANNKRSNRIIEAYGEKHTVTEWANILGLNEGTIRSRLKRGIDGEAALKSITAKAGE